MSLGMKPHTSHPHGLPSTGRRARLVGTVALSAAVLNAAMLLAGCSQQAEAPSVTQSAAPAASGFGETQLTYPTAARGDVVDDYLGK